MALYDTGTIQLKNSAILSPSSTQKLEYVTKKGFATQK